MNGRPRPKTRRARPLGGRSDHRQDSNSAIGTLGERTTRYVMLLHLPAGRSAEYVSDALIQTVQILPPNLTRSLTWDQGSEMGRHHEFAVATDTAHSSAAR